MRSVQTLLVVMATLCLPVVAWAQPKTDIVTLANGDPGFDAIVTAAAADHALK